MTSYFELGRAGHHNCGHPNMSGVDNLAPHYGQLNIFHVNKNLRKLFPTLLIDYWHWTKDFKTSFFQDIKKQNSVG